MIMLQPYSPPGLTLHLVLPCSTARALYHCNYCQKDISNTPRIKCAECADFDLCLECFSVGVEIAPHRNTHDYRVVDNLSFPILDPEWGVGTCTHTLQHVRTCSTLNRRGLHSKPGYVWCACPADG